MLKAINISETILFQKEKQIIRKITLSNEDRDEKHDCKDDVFLPAEPGVKFGQGGKTPRSSVRHFLLVILQKYQMLLLMCLTYLRANE